MTSVVASVVKSGPDSMFSIGSGSGRGSSIGGYSLIGSEITSVGASR